MRTAGFFRRAGLVFTVGFVILCGTACAATQKVPQSRTTPAAAQQFADPAMVMITLGDKGYHASDIALDVNQPAMFMVVNRSSRPAAISATIPLSHMETMNPVLNTQQTQPGGDQMIVDVAPGQEIDVAFTPTARGHYAMNNKSAFMGNIVVN